MDDVNKMNQLETNIEDLPQYESILPALSRERSTQRSPPCQELVFQGRMDVVGVQLRTAVRARSFIDRSPYVKGVVDTGLQCHYRHLSKTWRMV